MWLLLNGPGWWIWIKYDCFLVSKVWLTIDCISHSLTRSILQQLFYGLMFPNILEAGEQPKLRRCKSSEKNSFSDSPTSPFHVSFHLTCLLFLADSADEDIPDAMFKESCITEQTQYFFDNDERSYSGVLDCGNCSRYLSAIIVCLPI